MLDPIRLMRRLVEIQTSRLKADLEAGVRSVMLLLAATLLLVAGVVMLMVGAYVSLAMVLVPWQAAALVALVALLLAAVLYIFSRTGGARGAHERQRMRRESITEEELEEAAELGAAASEFFRRYRPEGVDLTIAALVAGLVFSRAMRGRRRRRRQQRD